jgi:hypothetical protein
VEAMKFRYTLVMEQQVRFLEHYEASTLEDAAKNQQKWLDDGVSDILDIVLNSDIQSVRVEAVDGE